MSTNRKYQPACLSADPPCAPKPRTSETVTPRMPIFSRAFIQRTSGPKKFNPKKKVEESKPRNKKAIHS